MPNRNQLKLFLSLVWRKTPDGRYSIATAWRVAKLIWGDAGNKKD